MVLVAILVVVALILVNAVYVAAEFSAVSVRRSRIQQLAHDGNPLAAWLLPVIGSPKELDRYIAACQIGITLSSLVLGAYGQAVLAPPIAGVLGDLGGWETATAHSVAFAVVLVGLSVSQMVFGELIPKALALQFPVGTALLTTSPMAWSLRLFMPLIWLFNGSGLALLRLIGVRQDLTRVQRIGVLRVIDRDELEGVDLLDFVLFFDLEVVGGQIGHWPALAVRDDHIDAHRVDPRPERRLLRRLSLGRRGGLPLGGRSGGSQHQRECGSERVDQTAYHAYPRKAPIVAMITFGP